MNAYVEKLKQYLLNLPMNFGYDDARSLLEMLYYYYTRNNPIYSSVIRCQFSELNDILCKLPLKENDMVFNHVCDLCEEHERRAFLEGIRVGVCLISELSGEGE